MSCWLIPISAIAGDRFWPFPDYHYRQRLDGSSSRVATPFKRKMPFAKVRGGGASLSRLKRNAASSAIH
jgi:hypothetical protein